ncbi:NHL repeat containing protein [Candidatus Magnetomorum sp. HK-1]|nr:NHL repeat containing protein [Candidatus Magnetomorum sp. HK-1]
MNRGEVYWVRFGLICFQVISLTLCLISVSWSAEELYKFDRLWPGLNNLWHSNFFDIKDVISPNGLVEESEPGGDIVVDHDGFLYIADVFNNRIKKYSTNGQLVTMWGECGKLKGQFDQPRGIAVDSRNCIYVTDFNNHRIQKFTSDGDFMHMWGKAGENTGEFNGVTGIAIDKFDDIYVADIYNNRIQKFDSTGSFILEMTSNMNQPEDVTVDNMGHVYVANTCSSEIVQFTDKGEYLDNWFQWNDYCYYASIAFYKNKFIYAIGDHYIYQYSLSGELISCRPANRMTGEIKSNLIQIYIDHANNIYLIDAGMDCVWKLSKDEHPVFNWGSKSSLPGKFHYPTDIDVDHDGFIYVADAKNDRIQKFTTDARLVTHWGHSGFGEGGFNFPSALAISQSNRVYVCDKNNNRIQQFSSNGVFLKSWGGFGFGEGKFQEPAGIAVDIHNNVFVVDSNHYIQKFNSEGEFLSQWGGYGNADGKLLYPSGIDTDSDGNIYVCDQNDRIQKFDPEGLLLTSWGDYGNQAGQFYWPSNVTIDKDNHVWVVDTGNQRIQKFDANGNYLTSFGSFGTNPGQFRTPMGICIDDNDQVFVSDTTNNRIQVFEKRAVTQGKSKAIILAGGGKSRSNGIWDATQICTNAAYDTLLYRGFSKHDIYYLSPNTTLDLDFNRLSDDIDSDATVAQLKYAITEWAADAEFLVIYLVDHGSEHVMRVNEDQTVSANELDTWMDQIQSNLTKTIVFIYDACKSGSFLEVLKPPQEKKRIVITSTGPDENAHFISKATISFSLFFWNQILNGTTVYDAFKIASQAMAFPYLYQTGQIDDNGDGMFNQMDGELSRITDIGSSNTIIPDDLPIISSVSAPQLLTHTSTAQIGAYTVIDDDAIERVWATIIPPAYQSGAFLNPVKQLPTIELSAQGSQAYTGMYHGFHMKGTYQVVVYARNRKNQVAIPKITTVTIDSPIQRKAIVILGGNTSDMYWTARNKIGKLVCESLKFQGYQDENIYFLSPVQDSNLWNGQPTLNNCEYAINTWANHELTQNLVLYMTGIGHADFFELMNDETLPFNQLSQWLDQLQNTIPGLVTVIYDACHAASYIKHLKAPVDKERIVIASSGENQPSSFLYDGRLSFSSFFWEGILNGFSIENAFYKAENAFSYLKINQTLFWMIMAMVLEMKKPTEL